VILFALLLPVFAAFLSMLVNIFYVFDSTVRLQTALDRGVFAGAAKLSYLLNEVAISNWAIRKGFVELKSDFIERSQGGDECRKRLEEIKIMQNDELSRMETILSEAYREAFSIAREVVSANLPENETIKLLELDPLEVTEDDKPLNLLDFGDPYEAQRENVSCDKINGNVVDPTSNSKVAEQDLLKFMTGDRSPVFVAMSARASVRPLLFSSLLPAVEISVSAAASPVGGSLRNFAFIEASNATEAAENANQNTDAPYYRPVMLPSGIFDGDGGQDVPR